MPMVRPDTKPAAGTPPGGAAGTVWTANAMHATFSQAESTAISPSPFRALFDVTRRCPRARSSIMIGLVRATAICATLALGLSRRRRRGQGLQARRSRRFGGQAGSPDQERGGAGRQILRDAADRRRRRLQAHRFPRRPADPRPDRRHHARGQRQLAAAGPDHLPDPLRQFQRTDLPAGARLDRGLHRLSARRQRRRGGRCAGRARPGDVRAQAVASGAGCACGCRSTCARSPRCAASTRRCATSTASGCSITPSIPTAPRRAPASSSPRTSPSASTSRRSWRWPAPTSRR